MLHIQLRLFTWENTLRLINSLVKLAPICTGCEVSGHQWVLFPAFFCSCYPHTETVPAEGSARWYAYEQNSAATGQGTVNNTDIHVDTAVNNLFMSRHHSAAKTNSKEVDALSMRLHAVCQLQGILICRCKSNRYEAGLQHMMFLQCDYAFAVLQWWPIPAQIPLSQF